MSRFYHNQGGMGMGMGMNNFNPRRGGGPGGPMRGGFMGNQQFRSHPFQNPNQNRRNDFNKPPNQKPQLSQAPAPGPALTMKPPVREEKTAEKPKPATQALPVTPKIPSPPPKPAVTSPAPTSTNKPQEQQIKSQPTNVNGQQPKPAPAATPKPAPQPAAKPMAQAPKPIPQLANKPIPQLANKPIPQAPKPSPQQAPKPSPQQAPKPSPQQAPKPSPQQAPKPSPQQAPRPSPQQAPKPSPQQVHKAPEQAPGPQQQAPKLQHQIPPKPPQQQPQKQAQPPQQQGPRPGGAGPPDQGALMPQQEQTGPRPGPPQTQGHRGGHQQGHRGGHQQGHRGGHQQGHRGGHQQGHRGGFHQNQRGGQHQNQRGGFQPRPQASRPREQNEPKPMDADADSGETRSKIDFKLSMLLKPGEKAYTQRCRLFVGNMPNDITEEEFKKMFSKYGEPSEVFINKAKGFGFIRLESRALAEIAKAELDDILIKGRPLRVRFATHSAALSIKNLSPFVSNELLEEAFSHFGLVERAIVVVDDRGRSSGKGIVEFASKPAARKALDRCNDGVFLLTSSPRPVIVEPLEQVDDEDGLPEKLALKNPRYLGEREKPPRFAHPNSFEYEYSKRWKSLDEMEKQQRQQVEKNMQEAREKLESEMEDAYHEHQANLLRQDLLRRQEELRRMEEMHSQEMQKRKEMQLRQEEERRRREEEMLRKREMEEQLRRQREESYRMGNFMDRERDMRIGSGGVNMGDMPYGTPNQKFGMSGMSFEGQQGMSGSPNLMSGEMRSDRFSQSSTRGMGPGNGGYGRVREEFEGPAKKARF